MAVWPPSLPQEPERGSVSTSSAPNTRARTSFDRGRDFQRPISSGKPKPFSMRFAPLTLDEMNTFEEFYEDTLGQGSLEFEMLHPFSDLVRNWRFLDEENSYQISEIGSHHYAITVSLELLR